MRSQVTGGVLACLAVMACRPEPPPPGPPEATGHFRAEYGAATGRFAAFRLGLIENRFLDTIAVRLNDSLHVPSDITLATAHCDEANAFYTPSAQRVTLCYELFEVLGDRFAEEPGGEYLITGTVMFALMHELGHALVDILDLPTTGREEDAVDQLATILLLAQGPVGDSLAFGVVEWFAANARTADVDSLAFADDHGLELQRVYNLVCWIYGREPGRYRDLVGSDGLPQHRAARCPAEFARLKRSWDKLLAPHRWNTDYTDYTDSTEVRGGNR